MLALLNCWQCVSIEKVLQSNNLVPKHLYYIKLLHVFALLDNHLKKNFEDQVSKFQVTAVLLQTGPGAMYQNMSHHLIVKYLFIKITL